MGVGTQVDPGWKWDDKIPMSQGIRIGEFVYVSGQIALDPDGKVIGEGDMKAQSQRVFDNIDAILKQAGGSMDYIVKITAYLTDMTRYQEYNEVRAKVFSNYRPASTTVEVSGLAFKGLLVEVEAVAYLLG
jgi:reactive intermediate/imine deaminase